MNDKELIEFLCEENEAFAKDLADGHDLISTFDGHFVAWDEIISACGGGSYGNSPIELISDLINERDDMMIVLKDIYRITCMTSKASHKEQTEIFQRMRSIIGVVAEPV